ncbi:hypothetical protein P171DRAFT_61990 [Karstenula rhodostoma CBS 690.94]|uniref:Uncharacterized protein n=1 Tax=Karstenula rhodostoma CBS 690.94 TaxID=1392251 RepID=A0A9P4PF04_9PLEO|nr:hypothetical protein P171DRAFT_61990 [Karstenula rhodostoma CBS 690.94]
MASAAEGGGGHADGPEDTLLLHSLPAAASASTRERLNHVQADLQFPEATTQMGCDPCRRVQTAAPRRPLLHCGEAGRLQTHSVQTVFSPMHKLPQGVAVSIAPAGLGPRGASVSSTAVDAAFIIVFVANPHVPERPPCLASRPLLTPRLGMSLSSAP